jgi:hypothetical protein
LVWAGVNPMPRGNCWPHAALQSFQIARISSKSRIKCYPSQGSQTTCRIASCALQKNVGTLRSCSGMRHQTVLGDFRDRSLTAVSSVALHAAAFGDCAWKNPWGTEADPSP